MPDIDALFNDGGQVGKWTIYSSKCEIPGAVTLSPLGKPNKPVLLLMDQSSIIALLDYY